MATKQQMINELVRLSNPPNPAAHRRYLSNLSMEALTTRYKDVMRDAGHPPMPTHRDEFYSKFFKDFAPSDLEKQGI